MRLIRTGALRDRVSLAGDGGYRPSLRDDTSLGCAPRAEPDRIPRDYRPPLVCRPRRAFARAHARSSALRMPMQRLPFITSCLSGTVMLTGHE